MSDESHHRPGAAGASRGRDPGDRPDPIIEVRDLVSEYGDRRILDGVGLTVRPREIAVIMGRSGSGKSTLVRHLLGLRRPVRGSVRVLGTDVGTAKRRDLLRLRRSMGVAFQHGALFSSLTVAQNVELPLRENTKLDENTIRIVARMKLSLMDLSGSEDLMPAQLSGGMAKRAGLARAAAMDPKLLFFDEPSAGLDPVTSAELDELILKLRDALHMTVVVVTHELESAFKIADRIVVIGDGAVIANGTPEEVRSSEDVRVVDMLERRTSQGEIDVDEYLRRLTE